MAKPTNSKTKEPLNKNFQSGEGKGPKRERFKNSPQRIWDLWREYKRRDPQSDKREAILRSYQRQPYKTKVDETCVIRKPSRTNFGMLAFKVDKKRDVYLDMINERERSFQINTEYYPSDEEAMNATLKGVWAQHISHAFERYFIREWDGYGVNMETDVLDMLLFSNGIEYWPSRKGARSKHIDREKVYPNIEAGVMPDDWDTCAVEVDFTWVQMWENIKDEKIAKDAGWNRSAIIELMRRSEPSWRDEKHDSIVRQWERGEVGALLENQTMKCVVWFATEFEKDGDGRQISKYIIPQVPGHNPDSAKKGGDQQRQQDDRGNIPMLFEHPYYEKKMSYCLANVTDNVGSGKFHGNPSFAESVYVACTTYDQKMNKVVNATELNSMLMTKGGDANAGKNMAKYVVGDGIHFPPGTDIAQQRFLLPIKDSLEVLTKVMGDADRGTGTNEIGQTGGGKTPVSAEQVRNDAGIAAQVQGGDLKRFNQQLTLLGRQWYRRFTTEVDDGDPEWEGLKKFKKYLKERGVPDQAWAYENVFVESSMIPGAGSLAFKFQNTARAIDLLNIVPRTQGQQTAIREGIAQLKGSANVERYFPPEDRLEHPTTEDWMIGQENESMKDGSVNIANIPVLGNDQHIKHLFGSGAEGVPPVGHLKDASQSLKDGLQLIQLLSETPVSDQPVLMDKVANIVSELGLKVQHSKGHVSHLAKDKSKQPFSQAAGQQIAQIERGINALRNQFEEAQQARMKELQRQAEAQDGREREAEVMKIQMDQARFQQDAQNTQQKHEADMARSDEKHLQKQSQENDKVSAGLQAQVAKDVVAVKGAEEKSKAQVAAAKAQAAAKPKTQDKK